MSELLSKIKSDALSARKNAIKNKNPITEQTVALYSTIVGAISRIEVDERRAPTDVDCVSAVKKILTGVTDTIKILQERLDTNAEDVATNSTIVDAQFEKTILEQYMPQQMGHDELERTIHDLFFESLGGLKGSKKDMGIIMKGLKDRHEGTYDGAMAKDIVTKILS